MYTVSRKALIEWLQTEISLENLSNGESKAARWAWKMVISAIESGRFDLSTESEGEADKLRAELDEWKRQYKRLESSGENVMQIVAKVERERNEIRAENERLQKGLSMAETERGSVWGLYHDKQMEVGQLRAAMKELKHEIYVSEEVDRDDCLSIIRKALSSQEVQPIANIKLDAAMRWLKVIRNLGVGQYRDLATAALMEIAAIGDQYPLGIKGGETSSSTADTAVQPWETIHSNFFQDFRCLVSDGDNFGMGGFMDGQWYADDFAPVISNEITHYMIIHPPGIKDKEPETAVQLRPALQWFAEQMEETLRRNDHKGGWEQCTLQYLVDKLEEEKRELIDELRWKTTQIIPEAADIANIAMMIADNARHLLPGIKDGREEA